MTKQQQLDQAISLLLAKYVTDAAIYKTALDSAKSALDTLNNDMKVLYNESVKGSPEALEAWHNYRAAVKAGTASPEELEKLQDKYKALQAADEARKQAAALKHRKLIPQRDASKMYYNLVAHELLKVQAKTIYNCFISFAGIFSMTNINSQSKKAVELLQLFRDAGINISKYDYVIHDPNGEGRNEETAYIGIYTGETLEDWRTRKIDCEYMKKELEKIGAPEALHDLLAKAENSAAGLEMLRNMRDKYEKDAKMLKSMLENTFMARSYMNELLIKYL